MFIPSELNWKEKGLKITQQTHFPESNKTIFTISTNTAITSAINIRYPEWASKMEIIVNGRKIKINKAANGYVPIERKWNSGDRIEVVFGMQLKLNPTKDNANVAAFTYGPIVLAGRRGTEGMIAPAPFSNPKLYNDYYTYDYHIPNTLSDKLELSTKNFQKDIKPINNKALNFKLEKEGITLAPLYKIHRERYTIYWNLNNKK